MQSRPTKWVTAAVEAHFGWPTARLEITYRGYRYLIRPETDELAPSVSVYSEQGLTIDEGGNLINRFLSELAWSQSAGVQYLFAVGSSTDEPIRVGKSDRFKFIAEPWQQLYLPQPSDERALRALAVFREALSVNSVPYKFLGLFKILNIRYSSGDDQKRWINDNRDRITELRAKERLDALSSVTDLGAYLYRQGRCAVAHAFAEDVIDPDASTELRRLEDDVPLIKAFAEIMITSEFGIPTDSEFWVSIRNAKILPTEYVQPKHLESGCAKV